MKELNKIIAVNIANLRKKHSLTQVQVAEKLCYSDKAVSKWETGETMPDIEVISRIAKMYNVTIDYLVTEHMEDEKVKNIEKGNKIIITLLSTLVIWMVATIIYVYMKILNGSNVWMIFIWAFPVSCIVILVFTSIFSMRKSIFIMISFLIWTFLAATFLQFLEKNIWPIFLIGVPGQIATILWSQLKRTNDKTV